MLWNIIRDWFVQYIWGGSLSTGVAVNTGIIGDNLNTNNAIFVINENISLSFGDWLSTISTIVTMILLIIMLFALIRFIVRQIAGLTARI